MKRRDFLTASAGTVACTVAWPVAGPRAQQTADGTRRIGVLMNLAETDPQSRLRLDTLAKHLKELGWTDGGTVKIDVRWAADDPERYRNSAAELVTLKPSILIAGASPSVAALQRETRTIPIVFANVIDPVGAGFVPNLARPGGNTTGFTSFEFGNCGKWLELLKQMAPQVTRVAVLRDARIAASIAQFAAIQSQAPSLGVEVIPIDDGDAGTIEQALAGFTRAPNGGMIETVGPGASKRQLIIDIASRLRLPAVYPFRYFAADGGLASFGPDPTRSYELAAGYVDRILKGEKPADLPVQAPTKYELVINLKTAQTLGLTVPAALLARADEVIE